MSGQSITHADQVLKVKILHVTAQHWPEAARHIGALEAEFLYLTRSSDHTELITITLEDNKEACDGTAPTNANKSALLHLMMSFKVQ